MRQGNLKITRTTAAMLVATAFVSVLGIRQLIAFADPCYQLTTMMCELPTTECAECEPCGNQFKLEKLSIVNSRNAYRFEKGQKSWVYVSMPCLKKYQCNPGEEDEACPPIQGVAKKTCVKGPQVGVIDTPFGKVLSGDECCGE